jgi:hypothetical protein
MIELFYVLLLTIKRKSLENIKFRIVKQFLMLILQILRLKKAIRFMYQYQWEIGTSKN